MTRYAVIGNSIAANSAAARIHSLDADSPITLFTDEPDPYYSRCALMYVTMGHCLERDIHIADDRHHHRLNASVVHQRVAGVDADAHELRTENGETFAYDRLLVACGARGRRLGAENEAAEGIYDFVSLGDVRRVMADIKEGKATRAVVIGGGLIGAEAAEVFHELGVPVSYLVREKQYLFYHVFCSHEQSRIIEERFEHHGVHMHMERSVKAFETDASGRVSAVIDDQGDRYEADIVIRSIGVEPATGFLEGSGIDCDRGVLVDDRLKNAAPHVWAAGDCAEIQFPGMDRTMIQKLWYTAQPQGWVAGENMTGGDATYDLTFQYQSAMFMDLDFCSYGNMPGPGSDYQEQTTVAGNGLDALRIVHDGSSVVGASFLGRAMTKRDIEHLVDTHMPLEQAVALAERALRGGYGDRAPAERVAERERLSRRPYLWPFGERPALRSWFGLTGASR